MLNQSLSVEKLVLTRAKVAELMIELAKRKKNEEVRCGIQDAETVMAIVNGNILGKHKSHLPPQQSIADFNSENAIPIANAK
jgi:hypothetical protein